MIRFTYHLKAKKKIETKTIKKKKIQKPCLYFQGYTESVQEYQEVLYEGAGKNGKGATEA